MIREQDRRKGAAIPSTGIDYFSLHRWGFLSVEGSFDLCRRGHAVLAVESLVVDPVDVGEGRSLEVLRPLPGSVVVDQLGLVEPVEALRERSRSCLPWIRPSPRCRLWRVARCSGSTGTPRSEW